MDIAAVEIQRNVPVDNQHALYVYRCKSNLYDCFYQIHFDFHFSKPKVYILIKISIFACFYHIGQGNRIQKK